MAMFFENYKGDLTQIW